MFYLICFVIGNVIVDLLFKYCPLQHGLGQHMQCDWEKQEQSLIWKYWINTPVSWIYLLCCGSLTVFNEQSSRGAVGQAGCFLWVVNSSSSHQEDLLLTLPCNSQRVHRGQHKHRFSAHRVCMDEMPTEQRHLQVTPLSPEPQLQTHERGSVWEVAGGVLKLQCVVTVWWMRKSPGWRSSWASSARNCVCHHNTTLLKIANP